MCNLYELISVTWVSLSLAVTWNTSSNCLSVLGMTVTLCKLVNTGGCWLRSMSILTVKSGPSNTGIPLSLVPTISCEDRGELVREKLYTEQDLKGLLSCQPKVTMT